MNSTTRILFSSLLAMILVTILVSVTNNQIVTAFGVFIIVFSSVLLFSKKSSEK
ncbi:hypothetical protein ACIQXF_01785 [Lysinibacillus sp. NPDC097231]|uniref:hypothetical protein n=1 Tax=Lysinibacillus sp. NPDC097231 TaxID=3364142 RepID=UPI003824F17E